MHKDRALWVTLAVLVLGFAAWMLRETRGVGWMPGCFFRQYTGIECPGCGMTRGTYAILHGEFLKGFLYNPVGMILFPLAMIGLGIEVIGWVRGKPLPFRLNPGRWGATVLAVVIIAWWILRNFI
jgi:hypothetical protein